MGFNSRVLRTVKRFSKDRRVARQKIKQLQSKLTRGAPPESKVHQQIALQNKTRADFAFTEANALRAREKALRNYWEESLSGRYWKDDERGSFEREMNRVSNSAKKLELAGNESKELAKRARRVAAIHKIAEKRAK